MICISCNKDKEFRAFLGARDVCRLCWHDMNEEERNKYHGENKSFLERKREYQRKWYARNRLKSEQLSESSFQP